MKRVALTLLCIVITASVLTSCNTGERPLTIGELLDLGEKYLLDLDYEQAVVCFTWAIEIEPNNTRALMGRGVAYFGLKRYDEAIKDYTRVIEIDAGIAEAYIRLSDVYIETGETEEAEKTLRKGLTALPGNAELELKLDGLLRGQGGAEPQSQSGAAQGATTEPGSGEPGRSAPGPTPGGPQYRDLPAHLTGQMDAIIAAYEARDEVLACNLANELNFKDFAGISDSAHYMYKGVLVRYFSNEPDGQRESIIIWLTGSYPTLYVMGVNCQLSTSSSNDGGRSAVWGQWTVDSSGNGESYYYMDSDSYTSREWGPLKNYLYHGAFTKEWSMVWADGALRTFINYLTYVDGRIQAPGPPLENGYMPTAIDADGKMVDYVHPDVMNYVHSVPAPR